MKKGGAILLALMLILWPLGRRGFFLSDDGEWMVIRLSAFHQSLREGQFPVRFLGRLNNSYGYPVSNFLYPGYLYLGAPLHAVGISFPDSVKIILAASVIASALFVFAWIRQYFPLSSATIGAMSFILAPYLAYDLYVRGSVGEVLAFVPASLSLYSIASGNLHLLPLAIGFLIISHNSLAAIFLVLIVLYGVVRYGFRILWYIVPGIGLASFFWVPAILERRFVLFDSVRVANPSEYFLKLPTYVLAGPAFVVSWFVLVNKKTWYKDRSGRVIVLLFVLFTILALSISKPVWELEFMAKLFQFPYRMLAPSVLLGAWITAAAVHAIRRNKAQFIILLVILFVLPAWYATQRVESVVRPEGFYTTNEATTTVSDEYMPRWVKVKPITRASARLEFFQGRGTIQIEKATTQQIAATIIATDDAVIQVNTVYYPGWGVTVDKTPVEITYDNPLGFMHIEVPRGVHTLYAEFRETIPRFTADLISLIFGISYLVFLIYRQWKREKAVV